MTTGHRLLSWQFQAPILHPVGRNLREKMNFSARPLILLTVVILNRRVALTQVNASLAEISRQLRELQKACGDP